MKKLTAFILILIIGSVLGALYGIMHDELTYTISEEYYTKFKFVQFRVKNVLPGKNVGWGKTSEIILENPRLGVAFVGIMATWWVGLIIGLVLGLVGLIHKTGRQMFRSVLKAFLLTLTVAFIFGLVGLVYQYFIGPARNWCWPDNLINCPSFSLVGSIHNFGYLGGFVGLIVGMVFTIRKKRMYRSISI